MEYSKYMNSGIRSVSPSGIRKFFDIANEMQDVISLSIGEPDFQTPLISRLRGISATRVSAALRRARHGTLRTAALPICSRKSQATTKGVSALHILRLHRLLSP